MGLTRVKFGKRQNCDNIRSMTLSGVTVTGVDCILISPSLSSHLHYFLFRPCEDLQVIHS